jgi:hypothetical protein
MKMYPVQFLFDYRCGTRGYAIPAETPEEAIDKAKQCITKHGTFDMEKYEQLGGDTSAMSWSTSLRIRGVVRGRRGRLQS